MSYTVGGGGGPAGSVESNEYALAQPFDISGGQFTAEMASQINQNFDALFKALVRTRTDIIAVSGVTAIWSIVRKKADEIRGATASDDTDLVFPMAGGTKYLVRGRLHYNAESVTGDFRWQYLGPSSPTLVNIARWALKPTATGFTEMFCDNTPPGELILDGAAGEGAVFLDGIWQNSASGNFRINWRGSGGTPSQATLRAGSYLEYAIVP